MRPHLPSALLAAASACLLAAACGSSAPADTRTPTASAAAVPQAVAAGAPVRDWPEFGFDPQRSDVATGSTGIDAANVSHLRRLKVGLPGTVDSSPVYLHGVTAGGGVHDVIVVTTTYGKTLAIDAASGRTLWDFTPPGYASWAGSAQITTAGPLADPGRGFVYTASPNGLIHKLSVQNGAEAAGWPARVTLEPKHEKLAAALNVDGPYLLATTGGYFGDAPPYQGHVVLIDRSSGHIASVFNTLCADRHRLIQPSSCASSDSAILSRGGAVVEPGGKRLLVSTGNAPWNGSTDFGDSVLELSVPGLRLRQAFTPTDQAHLNASDTDLGSSAPALLGGNRVAIAGKDGILRVLELSALDGRGHGGTHRLGGEVQSLQVPGGAELFTAPAVWRHGAHTTVFVADEAGTAAYVLRRGRLLRAWQNSNPGTSPVMAGGLLYVYDLSSGGIEVYRPGSPAPLAKLPGSPGHWNSPVVADGHVIEPEGNGNDHSQSGTLEIFSAH